MASILEELRKYNSNVRAEIALQNCSDPLSSTTGSPRRVLYSFVLLGLMKHRGLK